MEAKAAAKAVRIKERAAKKLLQYPVLGIPTNHKQRKPKEAPAALKKAEGWPEVHRKPEVLTLDSTITLDGVTQTCQEFVDGGVIVHMFDRFWYRGWIDRSGITLTNTTNH